MKELKFLKLYESLRAQGSPAGSIIKDIQVGDIYLWLVKSGNKFLVKKGQGSNPNEVRMKVVFSGSEESATKKFNTLWNGSVSKV